MSACCQDAGAFAVACDGERRGRAELRDCRSASAGCVSGRREVGVHGPPESHPLLAASILATSIFFISIIASKARLASSPPAAIASVSTRGVICQEMPHLSLHHPHWLSCPPLPTIAFQ